jgi:hypothetical protein
MNMMIMNDMNLTSANQTDEEIGGLAYILKYAAVYIPYTAISLLGFIVGLIGKTF